MRSILALSLSFLLLASSSFGQSYKPLGVVLPPTVMGNVSESRKQILLNTLDNELSKHFDVSPPTQSKSSKLEVVSNVFQLQIVEEDRDTQLSLRWINGEKRRVETELCGGCKTIELNESLIGLVGRLVGVEEEVADKPVVVEKSQRGVLFRRKENGVLGWFKDDNEKTDDKYVGKISYGDPNGQGTFTTESGRYVGEWKDGKFNGQGTYTYPNGAKYLGQFKDWKIHGQGTWTHPNGRKYVGEWKDNKYNGEGTHTWPVGTKYVGKWKDNKPWNITEYDKNGNIIGEVVNGVRQ